MTNQTITPTLGIETFRIIPQHISPYLTLLELARLDSALCSSLLRKPFLEVLAKESTPKGLGEDEIYSGDVVQWLNIRDIKMSALRLHKINVRSSEPLVYKMPELLKRVNVIDKGYYRDECNRKLAQLLKGTELEEFTIKSEYFETYYLYEGNLGTISPPPALTSAYSKKLVTLGLTVDIGVEQFLSLTRQVYPQLKNLEIYFIEPFNPIFLNNQFFGHYRSLESVKIYPSSGCYNYFDSCVRTIVQHNKGLKRLEILGKMINTYPSDVLREAPGMLSLSMYTVESFKSLLSLGTLTQTLQSLTIQQTHCAEGVFEYNLLPTSVTPLSSLTYLNISGATDFYSRNLLRLSPAFPNLQKLDISNTICSFFNINKEKPSLPNLKALTLSHTSGLKYEEELIKKGIHREDHYLSAFLRNNPSVDEIELCGCEFDYAGGVKMFDGFEEGKVLRFRDCLLTNVVINQIAQTCQNLRRLYFMRSSKFFSVTESLKDVVMKCPMLALIEVNDSALSGSMENVIKDAIKSRYKLFRELQHLRSGIEIHIHADLQRTTKRRPVASFNLNQDHLPWVL